ncbi:hypothetical protein HanRHA438_Chr01g0017371 [Helianthus annuus]|nr:hypothetical protein HanRHA438_Chr01g0017371 [Helianthus annuus]
MCTVKIKARYSTNDLNVIITSYLRNTWNSILRGPSVSILSRFSFVSIVKVKLRLTFCFEQFMVKSKFV